MNRLKEKDCAWCKHTFVPRKAGKPQKFCSPVCKRESEKDNQILTSIIKQTHSKLKKDGSKNITWADILNELSS